MLRLGFGIGMNTDHTLEGVGSSSASPGEDPQIEEGAPDAEASFAVEK